jgi:excisionase family DNA binding protein
LTVEEAARELRIGRSAAYEAVRRGQLPAVRIGRSLRVPRHQLEALLERKNGDGPAGMPSHRETHPGRKSNEQHSRGQTG